MKLSRSDTYQLYMTARKQKYNQNQEKKNPCQRHKAYKHTVNTHFEEGCLFSVDLKTEKNRKEVGRVAQEEERKEEQ